MRKTLSLAAAALYAAGASAAPSSFCTGSSNDVCFQWAVPQESASSKSGDIYFQLRAPTAYTWVGLGIGQAMAGADMFVMYQSGDGNVTLSTRAGKGHVMPEYTKRDDFEILPGSGVSDGHMVANARCGSCSKLDLGGETRWISAWQSGDSLDSSELDASISQHDDVALFRVDLAKATIESNQNPFTSAGNNGTNSGVEQEGEGNTKRLIRAHGIVMAIVFAAAYPIGALLMPIVRKWYIHASWQTLAFLGMWAGFALGYIAADRNGIFFSQTHTRLGTIVIALLGLQPILGWLHHQHYVKYQKRSVFSYVHIFYGQILMLLGIINGGLGLRLAGSPRGFMIAYSIIAAVCSVAYIGASALRHLRSSPAPAERKPSHRTNESG